MRGLDVNQRPSGYEPNAPRFVRTSGITLTIPTMIQRIAERWPFVEGFLRLAKRCHPQAMVRMPKTRDEQATTTRAG